eukprot:TRINITY_DN3092_c0_g1_i1.p4 TRINITY_DN3092_c0_g1~~TRINITY_DN3092_c0_g1_i1.p4  ORF type:complete len:137 (-),score=25.38 TRINITY_DN3092_c0_g1_i1:255-665(-)
MSWSGGAGYTSREGLNSRHQLFGGQNNGQVQITVDPTQDFDLDNEVGLMQEQVSKLKNLAGQINDESKENTRIMDELQAYMDRAKTAMSRGMKRLTKVYKQGGSNHLLYLVLFALAVFMFLYFFTKVVKFFAWFVK